MLSTASRRPAVANLQRASAPVEAGTKLMDSCNISVGKLWSFKISLFGGWQDLDNNMIRDTI